MDGSAVDEKSYFKMFGLPLSSKLDGGSYIVAVSKTAFNKIGALILSMKFCSSKVLSCFIYMKLRYDVAWNIVVMSGMAYLIASWIFWINCRNRCMTIIGYYQLARPIFEFWLFKISIQSIRFNK